MFAIVETGGKQYKIAKGTTLDVNQIDSKEGATFNIEKVLLISDKTATKVGTPLVSGAYATAKVVSHRKGEKIIVFKMKAKKRYSRTRGFRSRLTTIEITDIKASGAKSVVESATKSTKKPSATKTLKKPAKPEKAA